MPDIKLDVSKINFINTIIISLLLFLNVDCYLYILNTVLTQEYAFFIAFGGFLGLIGGYILFKTGSISNLVSSKNTSYYAAVLFIIALSAYHLLNLSKYTSTGFLLILLFIAFSLQIYRLYYMLAKKEITLHYLFAAFMLGAALSFLTAHFFYDIFSGPVWTVIILNTAAIGYFLFIDRKSVLAMQPLFYVAMLGLFLTIVGFNPNAYISWKGYAQQSKLLPTLAQNLDIKTTKWNNHSRQDLTTLKLNDKTTTQWLFKNGDSFGPVEIKSTVPEPILLSYPLAAYPVLYSGIHTALTINLPILKNMFVNKHIVANDITPSMLSEEIKNKAVYDLIEINISTPERQQSIVNTIDATDFLTDYKINPLFNKLSDKGKMVFLTNKQAYVVKAIIMLIDACEQNVSCQSIEHGITILKLKTKMETAGNPFTFLLAFDKNQSTTTMNDITTYLNSNVVDIIFSSNKDSKGFYKSLVKMKSAEQASKRLEQSATGNVKRVNVDVSTRMNPDFYVLEKTPGKTIILILAVLTIYILVHLLFLPAKREQGVHKYPLPMAMLLYLLVGVLLSTGLVYFSGIDIIYPAASVLNTALFYFIVAAFTLLCKLYNLNKIMYVLCVVCSGLLVFFVAVDSNSYLLNGILFILLAATLGYVLGTLGCQHGKDMAIDDLKIFNLTVTGLLLGFVITQYLFKTSNFSLIGIGVASAYFLTICLTFLFKYENKKTLHHSDIGN